LSAVSFFRWLNATQHNKRLPASFLRRHTRPQIVFNMHLQMTFQLFGELLVLPVTVP
jgi:hypothetical protein